MDVSIGIGIGIGQQEGGSSIEPEVPVFPKYNQPYTTAYPVAFGDNYNQPYPT